MASRRVYRKRKEEGGVLLGLCAGIGEHLNIDPVLVRLVFVMLLFMNVAGISAVLIYLLFSLFIPFGPEQT